MVRCFLLNISIVYSVAVRLTCNTESHKKLLLALKIRSKNIGQARPDFWCVKCIPKRISIYHVRICFKNRDQVTNCVHVSYMFRCRLSTNVDESGKYDELMTYARCVPQCRAWKTYFGKKFSFFVFCFIFLFFLCTGRTSSNGRHASTAHQQTRTYTYDKNSSF